MAIWFLAGIKDSRTVALSGETLKGLGYRAMHNIEVSRLLRKQIW